MKESSSESVDTMSLFSTFFVNGLYFGMDVSRVQEVLQFQPMTSVPKAPAVVEGLLNLRGQIVTALEMRRRLQLPARSEAATPMNMVIRSDEGAVSLLVDEIGDVVEVDRANCERPPGNLDAALRGLIRGVYKLNDRLLLELDADRIVDISAAKDPTQSHGS